MEVERWSLVGYRFQAEGFFCLLSFCVPHMWLLVFGSAYLLDEKNRFVCVHSERTSVFLGFLYYLHSSNSSNRCGSLQIVRL